MSRGFFFTLDAFLGAVMLIGGLILVLQVVDYDTDITQLEVAGEDAVTLLNTISVREIHDPWVQNQIINGSIDENATLLEQVGLFWALGDLDDAEQLAALALDPLYPDEGIRLAIEDTVIYERNGTKGGGDVLVASQMISGIAQGEAITGSSASAYLRRIEDKRSFIVLTLGGFVGEGNISYSNSNIPSDANITDIILEVDTERDFTFTINGNRCDHFVPNGTLLVPSAWNRTNCTTLVNPGSTNSFDIDFSGSVNGSLVAGGFIKITYTTDSFSELAAESETIYSFPYIEGLINLFDGFYVNGNVSSMNVTLHFRSNYTTYLTIGNASWQFTGQVADQTVILNESQIGTGLVSAGLTYADLSKQTIPIRFGIGSVIIEGAPSDTIMVTDTSGSMEWCTNQTSAECFDSCPCGPCNSGGGTCGSSGCGIYSTCAPGDTERIEAAKNATVDFISFMLNSSDTLVGLVEFASSVKSSEPLTNDEPTLTSQVNSYTANGGTCICCGVNEAVTLLTQDAQTFAITRQSPGWLYNDQDLSSPPSGWTDLGYDDSSWSAGTTAVGWGSYSNLNSVIPWGNRYEGDYYHRRKFNLTNTSNILDARLFVRSDDGADVYLNGNLIDSDYGNVHTGLYWNRNNISVDPGLFVEGENIVAVRQWHRSGWWNRMVFDLELSVSYSDNLSQTRTKNVIVMTDGETNQECSEQGTGNAANDAIQSACDAYNTYGITVYTVGFGIDAEVATLQSMASCANGQYFSAANSTQLTDVFSTIADAIIDQSSTQRAIIEGSPVQTILYSDSIIQANYTLESEPAQANEIAISVQTDPLANCSDTVELFEGSRFLDAFVTSYSGEYWTDFVRVNGNTVYNLSEYADIYASLGDPYRIAIPPSLLVDGDNTIDLSIATDAYNQSTICSLNNTVVYSIAINLSTERSDALPLAEGCKWTVEVEGSEFLNLTIPTFYAGNSTCYYTSSNISFNDQDAYQFGAHAIFSRLDFKDEGRLFVNLNEEDLEVIVSTISGVPYMWGPVVARIEVSR